MSNPTDNSNNRNLKDLLDKAGQPGNLPADDFEKDALEGFSMLETGEAMNLKQNLDAKIYKDVFAKEKPKANYWLAAAALVLVVGFSVYFIKNNALTKTKDVAIATAPKKTAPTDGYSELPPPPILIESPAAETPPKAKAIIRSEPGVASAPTSLQEAESVTERFATDNISVPAKNETKFIVSGGNPVAPAKAQSVPMDMPVEENIQSADFAEAPKKEVEEKTVLPENSKKRSENKEEEPKQKDTELNVITNQVASSGAVQQTYSPPASQNSPTWVPNANATIIVIPYYKGGNVALQKDVKEKLAAKNLAQKFDATLYVNKSNAVEKVKFTKTYALTQQQQQQVIEVLKTLDKFTVDASVKKTSEYLLVFRP